MSGRVGLLEPVLTLLYPPRCLLCRVLGGRACLCAACAGRVERVPAPWCACCGQALGEPGACPHCGRAVPAFTRARSLGLYEGVLRTAIHLLKYRDRPQLAVPLGGLLAEFARAEAPSLNDLRFDAILPVPMHPVRQRRRGYNQAERLARTVGQELGLPLAPGVLIRTVSTHAQVGLTGDARRANLRGAFAVPRPDLAAGRTFFLIDDVSTTGSTLDCCAAALKHAGAKAVYALTLAAG